MSQQQALTTETSRRNAGESTWRPRLRGSVLVAKRGTNIQFTALMDLVVTEFEVEDFVFDLMQHLDGRHDVDDLLRIVNIRHRVSRTDLHDVLDVLRRERLLARSELVPLTLTRLDRQRYFFDELVSSFPALPESADDLQVSLRRSHVVVVGAGGAGSWVLQSLALAGVGTISVVDPDVVELSNLNRQVLFSSHDLGTAKADAVTTSLGRIDPEIRVVTYRQKVTSPADLTAIAQGTHLVINCADEPTVTAASDVVATVAQQLRIPHIVGGAYGANLGAPGVSVIPGSTTCWSCIRRTTAADHGGEGLDQLKGRTGKSGTVAPLAGLIGNLIAWEALRLLIGLPPALANRIREMDILSLEWRDRTVRPQTDCGCVPSGTGHDAKPAPA